MDKLKPVFIEANNLDEAWFKCLKEILINGHVYEITGGSFKEQKRLEFDYLTVHILYPSTRPIIPLVPEGVPPPTSMEYVEKYMRYWITDFKEPTEDYTYGERLVNAKVKLETISDEKESYEMIPFASNQIEQVIEMYKETGEGTNQATMQVAMPSDLELDDPPCLRHIDTRIRYKKLHFMPYFRSWDLWAGFPSNLAAIQLLKEDMARQIGVEDGEMIASSKGLHLYDYAWELAKTRVGKSNVEEFVV